MKRLSIPLAASLLLLGACSRPPGQEVEAAAVEVAPLVAPSPAVDGQPLALRRCDDGGDGGVLIDGICL